MDMNGMHDDEKVIKISMSRPISGELHSSLSNGTSAYSNVAHTLCPSVPGAAARSAPQSPQRFPGPPGPRRWPGSSSRIPQTGQKGALFGLNRLVIEEKPFQGKRVPLGRNSAAPRRL